MIFCILNIMLQLHKCATSKYRKINVEVLNFKQRGSNRITPLSQSHRAERAKEREKGSNLPQGFKVKVALLRLIPSCFLFASKGPHISLSVQGVPWAKISRRPRRAPSQFAEWCAALIYTALLTSMKTKRLFPRVDRAKSILPPSVATLRNFLKSLILC